MAREFEMKWISIKDELPEEKLCKFLVLSEGGDISVSEWYWYGEDDQGAPLWSFYQYGVSHWMELPSTLEVNKPILGG